MNSEKLMASAITTVPSPNDSAKWRQAGAEFVEVNTGHVTEKEAHPKVDGQDVHQCNNSWCIELVQQLFSVA